MASMKEYMGCALLIILGLIAIYLWQKFAANEWIVLAAGIVLIIFGIIAGIRIR